MLQKYLTGEYKTFYRTRDELNKQLDVLQILIDSWREKLPDVDLKSFLPSVFDYAE